MSSKVEELKQIDEEYKIWKKNTPYLYDIIMSHALEWPSLTVQWLPEKLTPAGCDYSVQRLLLGTHTSGEPNYVHIAELRLPLEDTEIDARAHEKTADPETAGEAAASSSSAAAGSADVGGYAATYGKVEIVQSIPHEGEVHRARVMPQQSHYIATKAPTPDVFVFDRSLHPARPGDKAPFSPDFRLTGHEKEGYGLSWSPREAGLLLSGSEDALICLWDLSSQLAPSAAVLAATSPSLPAAWSGQTRTLAPVHTYRAHTDVVEDVAWSPHAEWQFASCGDDKLVIIWDRRAKEAAATKIEAHAGEVNCLAYNPFNEHLLVSGSSDRTLGLWDLRNPSAKLHSFESHAEQVTAVEWAPWSETILASAAADRRVHVWDMARIGAEQEAEDAEDGPPELLFIHGGHTDKVVDFSWNPHDEWVAASVADDNCVQVWQIAQAILQEEADDDDKQPNPEDLE